MGNVKTAIVEARVDIRSMAVLVRYIKDTMPEVRLTRCGVVSICMEMLVEILTQNKKVSVLESTESALMYLRRMGLEPKGRGEKSLRKKLIEEGVREISTSVSILSREKVEEAIKKTEEVE